MKDTFFSVLGFLAVAAGVIIIVAGVWTMTSFLNFKDVPKEKWTCIDAIGYGEEVRWESKWPGTDVHVETENRIEFFALSCLAESKGNCFENEGWFGARIDVAGGPEPVSFSFKRDSTNVDDSYRHHVRVYWELARNIIAAFRAAKTAEIATLGRNDEVLKVTKIKLDGFGPEMDKCIAAWAKKKVAAVQPPLSRTRAARFPG